LLRETRACLLFQSRLKSTGSLHELTHWLIPYQEADDAVHELRGRIVDEYSRAEYIMTGLCVRLKDRPEYQNIRSTFPFLMKHKLAFLRQCLTILPLSKYQKFGTAVLQEVEKHYAGLRMDHAHSFLEIDLLHSNEEATRFRQCIISQKSGTGLDDPHIASLMRATS
jgi:hypothetical protein